jgi:cell division protein FtsQ
MIHDARFSLAPAIVEGQETPAIVIHGAVRASRWRILRVFAPDLGRSIFSVPLDERRRRLLAIDWVENATVSRLWPNHIVVNVTERKPVAFVSVPFRNGLPSLVSLIDEYGVILERPQNTRFDFPVLSGITEDLTEEQRRERVQLMQRVLSELGAGGKDVSEVNLASLLNVRIVVQYEKRAVELILGDRNFGSRFQTFLNYYPEIHRRSGPVASVDLRLDGRITVKGTAS